MRWASSLCDSVQPKVALATHSWDIAVISALALCRRQRVRTINRRLMGIDIGFMGLFTQWVDGVWGCNRLGNIAHFCGVYGNKLR